MKKIVTIVLALALVACLGFGLIACNPKNDDPATGGDNYIAGLNELTQGVDTTNHVITVGNTAATSGGHAAVGVPFNYA
jgi:hypothetical protein